MSKYHLGEVVDITADFFSTVDETNEKVLIEKGSRFIVGADKCGHYFEQPFRQKLPAFTRVSGYDPEGLAEYVSFSLCNEFDMENILSKSDKKPEDMQNIIAIALRTILMKG